MVVGALALIVVGVVLLGLMLRPVTSGTLCVRNELLLSLVVGHMLLVNLHPVHRSATDVLVVADEFKW